MYTVFIYIRKRTVPDELTSVYTTRIAIPRESFVMIHFLVLLPAKFRYIPRLIHRWQC